MAFGKKKEKEEKQVEVVKKPQTDLEKFETLFALSAKLDKQFKTENTLQRLDDKKIVAIPSINVGLPTFDYEVMQCGGIPRGRIVEIFGPESAGKTTFTLHVVAEEQRQGGIAAFVDAEHTFDPKYATKLGVDVDKLVVNQPDYGEQALSIVEALIKSGAVSLIVVDSAAALTPKAELEGEMGDTHVGLQARMMSQAMRKLSSIAFTNQVTIIFINQIREKIGVMYGNPETTPGGRALKFYSSVRLDVRRRDAITLSGKETDKNIIGHRIRVKAVKNKVGVPFRETELDLIYEDGFDKEGNTIEFAANMGILDVTANGWYSLDGEKLAHGKEELKEVLLNSPKTLEKVKGKIAAFIKAGDSLPKTTV